MNKFNRYIEWCVNELMDISTIDNSKEEVRMYFNGGHISLWFLSLSMVKEDMSKLNIPAPILTILYNMGLPTDLYSMVFGKYINRICDEIKKGLKMYADSYLEDYIDGMEDTIENTTSTENDNGDD